MIKLEVTIKEIESVDMKETTAIGTEISIREIGKNATLGEHEISKILKKRLKVDEKFQIESNNEELKEKLEKLLKSL